MSLTSASVVIHESIAIAEIEELGAALAALAQPALAIVSTDATINGRMRSLS